MFYVKARITDRGRLWGFEFSDNRESFILEKSEVIKLMNNGHEFDIEFKNGRFYRKGKGYLRDLPEKLKSPYLYKRRR